MRDKNISYKDHSDTIVALVTYLAITNAKSRTPLSLAKDLSLDEKEVSFVLDNFKSLFRKSKKESHNNGEYYYTLHARYAYRSQANGNDNDEEIDREPLSPEYLSKLFDFVSDNVSIEQENDKHKFISSNNTKTAIIAAAISFSIGVLTIFANYYLQTKTILSQKEDKRYEVTFIKKRESYSNFMRNVVQLFTVSTSNYMPDGTINLNVFQAIFDLEKNYYDLVPFLSKKAKDDLWKDLDEYEDFTLNLSKYPIPDNFRTKTSDDFRKFRSKFTYLLEEDLFERANEMNYNQAQHR